MRKDLMVALVAAAFAVASPAAGEEDEGQSGRAFCSLDELPPLTEYERQLSRAPDGGQTAVVLLSSGYKKDSWSESLFTTIRRIKILSEAGLGYAEVKFSIRPEEEAFNIAGRTILSDGCVIELQTDNIEISTSYGGIWGPEFVYRFRLPGAQPGAVIEYSYTISTQLGPGFRFNQWFLQSSNYTLRTRFSIDIPADFLPFSAGIENFSSSAIPLREQEDGRRIVTYSFADVPGLRYEPFMPPPASLLARLVVDYRWSRSRTSDPFTYWRQFGRDQSKRTDEFLAKREGVSELVEKIIPNGIEAKERAGRICTWVQEEIVHIAARPPEEIFKDSELLPGESQSVFEVLEQRCGSQMEITLLALAMLREAGLEAYLALAVSRQFGVLRRDFLSPHQFDQAFVGLVLPDEGLLFLHPAAPHCPPLGTPWDVQGILALICTPGGGGFARVPVSQAEDNLREHWIELAVGSRGDAAGTVITTYRGQENMQLKSLLAPLTPAQRADILRTEIGNRLKNAEVEDLVIRNLESYREPLEVEFSVRLPAFAKRKGDQLIFSPGLFAQVLLPDLDHERRTQPIYLPYPFVARIVEKISVPEDFHVQHVGPRSYRSDIGTHLVETEVLPRGLVWERKLVQQRIFFQSGEYFALQHFLSRIRKADSAATIAQREAK